MACCINCENINNNPNLGVRDSLATPVKLHACDIEAITGGGSGAALSNVTSVDTVTAAASYDIPAGFIHGSIVVLTGTANINGAAYTAGESLNLPPMFPTLRYPIYQITAITGTVRVNYHTLP